MFDLIRRRSFFTKFFGGALASAAAVKTAAAADAPAASFGIKNIGICVSDIERSKKFYTEVFGFTADAKPTKIGAPLANLMEVKELDLTIQFVETGAAARIELLQFATPKAMGDGKKQAVNRLGLTHLQIKVADVAKALAQVPKSGGTVLEGTKLARGDALQAIFVLDPDGQRIEIIP